MFFELFPSSLPIKYITQHFENTLASSSGFVLHITPLSKNYMVQFVLIQFNASF